MMSPRGKQRNRIKKSVRSHGLCDLKFYLQKIPEGSFVTIVPAADVHDHFPPKTFHGHVGVIKKRFKSNIYQVYVPSLKKIYLGSKAHLKEQKNLNIETRERVIK